MQPAGSHPDMGVILSPGFSVGTENYCTKMSGEETPPKIHPFDKGFQYYHKCVSTALLSLMRCLSLHPR